MPAAAASARGEILRAAILVVLSLVAIDIVLPAILELARQTTLP